MCEIVNFSCVKPDKKKLRENKIMSEPEWKRRREK